MKALIKVTAKFRPCSGELQGYRLQAAIPNMAGRKMIPTDKGMRATKQEVPSFTGSWLIRESMDYADESLISPADFERFKQALLWEGFDEYEMVTKAEKPSKKLTPEMQAKIDAILARLGVA